MSKRFTEYDNSDIIMLFRDSGEANFIKFLDNLEEELENEEISNFNDCE